MCGLAGLAGNLNHKHKDILSELLVTASLRGWDSTGVAAVVEKTGEILVTKAVGNPYDLFQTKDYDRVCSSYNKQALIGHARKATVGGISKYTAHPFEEGTIVGVHNGTLTNWRTAFDDLEKGFADKFTTDSQTLIGAIAKFGVADTLARTKGAYAIVWFDKSDNSLNFIRNKERDLWYCYGDDVKTMYWSSEWRMMSAVLHRNNISTWDDEENRSVFRFTEDIHYKFDMGNVNSGCIRLLAETEVKGDTIKVEYKPPFQQNRWQEGWTEAERNGYQRGRVWNMKKKCWEEPGTLDDDPTVPVLTTVAIKEVPTSELEKAVAARLAILRGTTQDRPGATTTASTTTQPLLPAPQNKATPRQRSTLTLVPGNKNVLLDASGNPIDLSRAELDNRLKSIHSDPLVFDNEVLGWNGVILNKKQFERKAKHGCAFCMADVTFEEAQTGGVYKWMDNDHFVCSECTGVEAVRQFVRA